jgi:hypothetical protein
MNRRARRDTLTTIMPGLAVQMREAPSTLSGSLFPSLNCVSKEREPV